jgi:hypothetical protein
MKLLLRYILAFSYLLLVVQPSIPLAQYLIQKEYYAEKLCENKSKPQLRCEGKCALKKQLLQAEKKSEDESPSTGPEPEYSQPAPHLQEESSILFSLLTEAVPFNPPLETQLSAGFNQMLHPPPQV